MAEKADKTGRMRHGPGGGVYRIVATAAQTDNRHFAMEVMEPPGGGPPLHSHSREDEFFTVLEGEFTFWVDGKVEKVSAGMAAYVPRGTKHCFKNCTSQPSRMLVIATPGDIGPFFDYGLPLANGSAPSDQVMFERIMSMVSQFGLQILGPAPI